jgi:D-arabinose 1-dehydrogenase-like Zn-dependent alcohol dehydrogenase
LRVGGVIAQVGALSGPAEAGAFPVASILHKQARIHGIYVGSRKDFEDMNQAISLVGLQPVLQAFPWSLAREVLARMEEASHFGKLVLTIE